MTQELRNKNLMLSVLSAFKRGDLEPLFAAISDDVVWKSTAPPEFFRFGGIHHGRAGVKEFTALLLSRYHIAGFDPTIVVAQGDIVWGQFKVEAQHLPSGKTAKADFSIRWVVRNNKLVEHQGIFDTAGVLMQQGDLVAA
jgi:ketosteroid isomerase-like protein